jgi:hypothetical protein
MTFNLGVKLPNAYGGTGVPKVKSWLEKDGRVVLSAATDADLTGAGVVLAAAPADSGSVTVAWGVDPTNAKE